MKLVNKTRSVKLIENIELANTYWKRFIGLMGRKNLPEGAGMIIIPNNSVHCFFMRIPIDVLFVDKNQQIVYIYPNMRPWRVSKIVGKAHYVVELPAHTAQKSGTIVGDLLEWQDEVSGQPYNPIKTARK